MCNDRETNPFELCEMCGEEPKEIYNYVLGAWVCEICNDIIRHEGRK